MEGRKIVGWNVRKLRVSKGLTLEDLASRADTAATYLASLERGEVNAGVDLLDRLAKRLGVELADLTVKPKPGEKPPAPLKAGRRPQRQPVVRASWQEQHHRVRELLERDMKRVKGTRGHTPEGSFYLFPLLADGGPTLETFIFMREMDWVSPETVRAIDDLLKASGRVPEPIAKPAKRSPAIPSGWHRQRQLVRELLEKDMGKLNVDIGGGLKIRPGLDPVLSHSLFISDYGPTPEVLQHLRAVDWIGPETIRSIDQLLEIDSQRPRRPAAKPQEQTPEHERKGKRRRNPQGITRGRLAH